ncbi:MAG TPA: Ig-like domain-containing protein, partial [Cytophagaceae bacterium]
KFVITGIEGDLNWTKCEVEVVPAPVGAYYARVRLNVNKGEGTVWFDNISLTEVVAPTELAYITVTADKTQLKTGETVQLIVKGILGDGREADLSGATIIYTSSAPHVVAVDENGIVTAGVGGTANINVKVELNGVTKMADITFNVISEINTYVYDLRKENIMTNIEDIDVNGWIVQECSANYRHQVYGIQVQTNSLNQYIKFAVKVPQSGFYTVKFTGAGATGGAIADIIVDDMYVGTFDFYLPLYKEVKDSVHLKTLALEAGIHYVTIKAVDKPAGSWGYNMYPAIIEFIGRESLPSLEYVEATVDKSQLAVGQTAKITVRGVMSDGYVDLLRDDDSVIEYISSSANVASVDKNGVVKALEPGQTNITVRVTLNGSTKEAIVPITVNDKVLATVELQLEKNEIPVGLTTRAVVTAKLNDGSIIDLKDATVEYSSDNEGIAIVDQKGIVTAVAEGTANILATVTLGNTTVTGRAQLFVVPVRLETIIVKSDKTKLFVGRRATLTIAGIMNNAIEADLSNAKISYKMYSIVEGGEPIEDYTLAEINEENGVTTVTAKKPGTLKIAVEVELDGVIKTNDEVVITIESTEGIKCSKTKPTYYTEEKIAAARENIEKYDWARAIRDAAVELAEVYVDKAEFLWNIVSSQSIPRSMTVNPQYICPNCKTDLRQKYGNYPWLLNINEPWKIECPNCHVKFPTNDFESYYKLGLDSNGIFNPDLAKQRNDELIAKGERGYLVNVLYPEKGSDWGVDDGYGWVDENGVRHTFIAYYAHWGIW